MGTRYAESATRSTRMTARGESATSVWTDADGSLKLSLIADWSDEDVWRYILDCHTSLRASYSDFSGVLSLYKCGSGASEHPLSPLDGKIPSRCRFGCALCTVGRDESMANMLRLDPQKYGYMAGLHQLQQFLLATQHDWSRRQWVGRSLCNGYVAIGPDVYSPAMLEEILRYALSLDVREKEAAATAGIAPRFELVSSQALIAIDAMWSLHGYHRPFHALKIFRDIYIYGHRWDIPTITAVPKKARPAARYLYVGENWDEGHSWAYTGLREPFLESGDSPCAATKVLRNGHEIIDVQTSPAFEINEEAAEFLLHYELDRLIEEYHDDSMYSTTAGYRFYAQLGAISFAQSGQPALIDTTLRRTSFKERHGLVGQLSAHRLSNLLARTIAAPVGPTPRQGILSVYRRAEMALAS